MISSLLSAHIKSKISICLEWHRKIPYMLELKWFHFHFPPTKLQNKICLGQHGKAHKTSFQRLYPAKFGIEYTQVVHLGLNETVGILRTIYSNSVDWKFWNLDSNFSLMFFFLRIQLKNVIIGSGNSLVLNRQQAIAWTSNDIATRIQANGSFNRMLRHHWLKELWQR